MKTLRRFFKSSYSLGVCFAIVFLSFFSNIHAKSTKLVVDAAGFEYDYIHNIYVTKTTALQRFFGFNRGYDYMSTVLSMVIDAEPIQFMFENKWYMIELWKGQYYASTGGEIGFYHKSIIDGHWESAHDEQMLQMSFDLYRKGQQIFSRNDIHWWLTGFKPGVFSEPHDLSLENISLTFNKTGMGKAFYFALIEYFTPQLSASSYNVKFIPPNTVTFRWDIPRKAQDHLSKRKYYQIWNRVSANSLFLFMNPDYSPENIDRKLSVLKKYLKFTPIDANDILGFEEK